MGLADGLAGPVTVSRAVALRQLNLCLEDAGVLRLLSASLLLTLWQVDIDEIPVRATRVAQILIVERLVLQLVIVGHVLVSVGSHSDFASLRRQVD